MTAVYHEKWFIPTAVTEAVVKRSCDRIGP